MLLGRDRFHDGGIQCLVFSGSNRIVEFSAGLHFADHRLCCTVAPQGRIELLLCLVCDKQRKHRRDHHPVAHRLEFIDSEEGRSAELSHVGEQRHAADARRATDFLGFLQFARIVVDALNIEQARPSERLAVGRIHSHADVKI